MVDVMECHAKPKRSIPLFEQGGLRDMNEILRRFASQNAIGQVTILSRGPSSGDREIPGMLLVKAQSLKSNEAP